MKRRTEGPARLPRKPIKRVAKINPDTFYGGSVVYGKLLLLWICVLAADYFLEFRFEYLWPAWLFMRSVYDSYKYQGLAFSVFFICIAVTSDMICYLFVPVHWLFFAASTYVWVQYVWHTEKGVCIPTVFLWLLFIYVEASIRLKEFKASVDLRNMPFHLDLCRPFASHCIGYPVVTLGFGFKSYVGYRMRMRRQKEVQRENDYYFDFLRMALPPGQLREEAFNAKPSPKPCLEDRISEAGGVGPLSNSHLSANGGAIAIAAASSSATSAIQPSLSHSHSQTLSAALGLSGFTGSGGSGAHHLNGDLAKYQNGSPPISHSAASSHHNNHSVHVTEANGDVDGDDVSSPGGGGGGGGKASKASNKQGQPSSTSSSGGGATGLSKEALRRNKEAKMTKEEMVVKLETDVKRLKVDLQISRNKENDLRDQIISSMSSERHLKSEISNMQVEKSVLESRISGLLSTRASEKAAVATLEKKLADERKQKTEFQIKLETERKIKKEAANAERTAQQNQTRSEVLRIEAEIKTLRSELQGARERYAAAEQEVYLLRKYKETHGDPEVLVTALKATQEKKDLLEQSLSSETKVKMDLFSALGEAKREVSMKDDLVRSQKDHITELKAKIAEVLAVMPHSASAAAASAAAGATAPAGAIGAPGLGALGKGSQQGSGQQGNTGNSFAPFSPTTLSLDLPQATDLSFTGKLSSLGLADLDRKLMSEDGVGLDNSFTFNGGAKNGDC